MGFSPPSLLVCTGLVDSLASAVLFSFINSTFSFLIKKIIKKNQELFNSLPELQDLETCSRSMFF